MGLFWEREGLRFACTQCSHCCRHEPGYVFLSQSDIDDIAGFLHVSAGDVVERYCVNVRAGAAAMISLAEKDNNDCVFWVDGGCSIYEARPVQCRTYPFWRTVVADEVAWEKESRECPGIGVGPIHTPDAIRRAIIDRQGNVPLVVPSPGESA